MAIESITQVTPVNSRVSLIQTFGGRTMLIAIRCLAALPGVLMLINGVILLLNPAEGVQSLAMTLQDGLGRSSQLGDTTAFFLGTALFAFYGAYKPQSLGLYAAAILLLLVAVVRVIAYLAHGADLATVFIVVEVVSAAWLIGAGMYLNRKMSV